MNESKLKKPIGRMIFQLFRQKIFIRTGEELIRILDSMQNNLRNFLLMNRNKKEMNLVSIPDFLLAWSNV